MTGPIQFLLNKKESTKTVNGVTVTTNELEGPVDAPAFSITKVLTTASIIIAPLAALVGKALEDDDTNFTPSHLVVLAVGLLGFLAIASAADVLARAVATSAEAQADAASERRDTENLIPFAKPLRATINVEGVTEEVVVLAAVGGSTSYYLIKDSSDALAWKKTSEILVLGPA